MTTKKFLIVYKKSAYQTYFQEYRDPVYRRLSKSGDKVLAHIKRSHGTHYESVRLVERVLKKNGIRYDKKPRGQKFNPSSYSLVLSVGGDGTFLDAARHLKNTPILGVNSDTNHSVGKFCSVNLDSFGKVLASFLAGRMRTRKIHRLQISVNQRPWPYPVLNDLLVCHSSPATMSHYFLTIAGHSEQQRSSGLWIATAAGSTGAIKSAGGKRLPLESSLFQYMPRELFEGHGIRSALRGGVLRPGTKVSLVSQMQKGAVYVDGAHNRVPWGYGDVLTVKPSKYPLHFLTA